MAANQMTPTDATSLPLAVSQTTQLSPVGSKRNVRPRSADDAASLANQRGYPPALPLPTQMTPRAWTIVREEITVHANALGVTTARSELFAKELHNRQIAE